MGIVFSTRILLPGLTLARDRPRVERRSKACQDGRKTDRAVESADYARQRCFRSSKWHCMQTSIVRSFPSRAGFIIALRISDSFAPGCCVLMAGRNRRIGVMAEHAVVANLPFEGRVAHVESWIQCPGASLSAYQANGSSIKVLRAVE